jgi:hypothetical protein
MVPRTLHDTGRAMPTPGAVARLSLPRIAPAIRVTLASLVALMIAAPHAHATWMFPAAPYRPKDCTLIRRGSTFHLFYTRGLTTVPFDSTWRDIGHAVSTDLVHWTDLAPVLPYRPGNWDNFQIWSPSVCQKDSVYYMFYTGVTEQLPVYDHHQRIGLATSTDLMNWTRLDQPVFECSQVPWAFCSPAPGPGDFRDPFVMPDPETPGHWLLFYTTRPAASSGNFVIGYARSSGDLTQWVDGGPLWNTFITHTNSSVVETPDVIRHGSLWYLLYTTWLPHPIWFQTAASPVADSTGWAPQVSLFSEVPGLNTDAAFSPEHYTVDGHDLYLMPDSDGNAIEILEYLWGAPPNFVLVEPYTTQGLAVAADTAGAVRFALHAVGTTAPIRLVLDLPAPDRVRVWISDATGRRIVSLLDGAEPSGRRTLMWDGRTARGDAAPSGIYFAIAEIGGARRATRIALLR